MPVIVNPAENMPRCDYPRPQWQRNEWYCLNGEWEFSFDYGKSGEARGMVLGGEYPLKINVPFCPESKLSGIEHTDFISAVWYRRTLNLEKLPEGRAILHFGAVDYFCKVWINGTFVGSHKGGYTAFEMDITRALKCGENLITVFAEDDLLSNKQTSGKQCLQYHSCGCRYTRTTGIYQTVWLEFVPESYLQKARITPRACDGAIDVQITVPHSNTGDFVKLTAYYNDRCVGSGEAEISYDKASLRLSVDEVHLWYPLKPELYDLKVELTDRETAKVKDTVLSYFALRDVSLTKNALAINGKPVFMRTILDQGFHPDGVYTAPDDKDLKRDIELAISLGFNGARFHKRVFEDRSLYWADKLGYLVWGEHASTSNIQVMGGSERLYSFLPEWLETVEQYYNHPSVIGWMCFNETYHFWDVDLGIQKVFYSVTKQLDPFRPVIDASGGIHYDTDMFDVHDYEQDPQKLKEYLAVMTADPATFHSPIPRYRGNAPARDEEYKGQPYWVSELGGTFWNPKSDKNGWGYGNAPKCEEEFAERYENTVKVLAEHPRICGFCYTQLTDIEQEQNGLYFYDRTPKFSKKIYERILKANKITAEIEVDEKV